MSGAPANGPEEGVDWDGFGWLPNRFSFESSVQSFVARLP